MMRGCGYILGVTFGAPLLFFLISFIFLRSREVSDEQVKSFIANSEIMLITNPIPLHTEYRNSDPRLGGEWFTKTLYLGKNSQRITAYTYTYFSPEFNKYIRAYTISEGRGMISEMQDFGREKNKGEYPPMFFYYNKAQNNDPKYGTLDNPLPILHFRSSKPGWRSMRDDGKDADLVYTSEVYFDNVKYYLEDFIEDENFERLFPEK